MDEHFRRSLGANYQSLFKKDEEEDNTKENDRKSPVDDKSKVTSTEKEEDNKKKSEAKDKDPIIKAFQEDMAMATGEIYIL